MDEKDRIYEKRISLGSILTMLGGLATAFTIWTFLISPIRANEIEKAEMKQSIAVMRAEFQSFKDEQQRQNAELNKKLDILITRTR